MVDGWEEELEGALRAQANQARAQGLETEAVRAAIAARQAERRALVRVHVVALGLVALGAGLLWYHLQQLQEALLATVLRGGL